MTRPSRFNLDTLRLGSLILGAFTSQLTFPPWVQSQASQFPTPIFHFLSLLSCVPTFSPSHTFLLRHHCRFFNPDHLESDPEELFQTCFKLGNIHFWFQGGLGFSFAAVEGLLSFSPFLTWDRNIFAPGKPSTIKHQHQPFHVLLPSRSNRLVRPSWRALF